MPEARLRQADGNSRNIIWTDVGLDKMTHIKVTLSINDEKLWKKFKRTCNAEGKKYSTAIPDLYLVM